MARFLVGLVAAVLFLLAGFAAMNEAGDGDGLRFTFMWLGLAAGASVVALTLPSGQSRS